MNDAPEPFYSGPDELLAATVAGALRLRRVTIEHGKTVRGGRGSESDPASTGIRVELSGNSVYVDAEPADGLHEWGPRIDVNRPEFAGAINPHKIPSLVTAALFEAAAALARGAIH